VIRGLAAILRVADALDRSHFGVVKNIEVRYSPGRIIVGVDSKREKADLETMDMREKDPICCRDCWIARWCCSARGRLAFSKQRPSVRAE